MGRRTRSLLLTAGLLAPVAVLAGPALAGAVDQDLVVSDASGAPGDSIDVSSASCVEDDDTLRLLQVRLISGTAPDEVLVAIGSSFGGGTSRLTIPDWVDAAAPAVIEASCLELSLDEEGGDDAETSYDPVAFDIEPGAGPATQLLTLSRTSLLAGQAFTASGAGCTLPGADFAGVAVFAGDDRSGRSWDAPVGEGGSDVDGSTWEAPTALANGGLSIGIGGFIGEGDPEVEVDIEEIPTDIPAGTYTVAAYCGTDSETSSDFLFYESTLIQVTGSAPTGDIDLVTSPESRLADLAGGSCTADLVQGDVFVTDLDDIFTDLGPGEEDLLGLDRGIGRAFPGQVLRRDGRLRISGATARSRVFETDDVTSFEREPGADGGWSATDEVAADVDRALLEGFAVCGDPLADGFIYDPQGAEIQVTPPAPTTTTTTTPPPPAPAPANAVPGTPAYAG